MRHIGGTLGVGYTSEKASAIPLGLNPGALPDGAGKLPLRVIGTIVG